MYIAQRLHLHASTLSDWADSSEDAVATHKREQEIRERRPTTIWFRSGSSLLVVAEDARRGYRKSEIKRIRRVIVRTERKELGKRLVL